jgi:hypothetical protein
MKRLVPTAVAMATVALLVWVTPAHATPITYTETATASGVLDGTLFTGALVTVTFFGDTSNVAPFGGGSCPSCLGNVPAASATVKVLGVGTDTFTDTVGIIGVPVPLAGLGNMAGVVFVDAAPGTSGLNILATLGNGLLGYDLISPIGPISGSALIEGIAVVYHTTAGSFQWNSIPGTATFTATESSAPVPEPASIMLLGTGLVAVARRRFKSRP